MPREAKPFFKTLCEAVFSTSVKRNYFTKTRFFETGSLTQKFKRRMTIGV